MKLLTQPIEFVAGNLRLNGILHLPDHARPPLVVGSHGLEGTLNSAKQACLARILPLNGMAFFRFNHRGCGQSQGDFMTQTTVEKRAEDFIAAVDAVLKTRMTASDLGIFGSSLGGSTCIAAYDRLLSMAAAGDIRLKGAVLCAAPVRSLTIENIPTGPTPNRGALPLSFFRDNLVFDILEKARHMKNLLIFHGDRDCVVPVRNAHDLYRAAQKPKKLIIQTGGDHQMTSAADQSEFEKEVIRWFRNCFSMDRNPTRNQAGSG